MSSASGGARRAGGEPRFFYGWVVVGVMAASGAVSMAMGSLNFGLFIKPMGDDLGIGRAYFGWAQTARQAAGAVASPPIGWLLDRHGSRVMLPVAALVAAAAMVGLANMRDGWHLIALFLMMGLVGLSGPGALVTSVPVLKWFVRDRGKAISFAGLGIPVGAMLFVPLTQFLIDGAGWRMAWVWLALMGAGVIVPLAAALVRRQPEDMGLLPDGAPPAEPEDGGGEEGAAPRIAAVETSWTTGEALRTSTMWRLVAMFCIVQLGVGTVALHRIAAFMDRGLDPTLIAFATAFDAVCAGVSTFAFGMLANRGVPARFLGAAGFAALAGASVMTIYADNLPVMFASMAIFGLGIGGMMFLNNFIWADYFGRENVGSIRGLANPINLAVGGLGAPAAGYVYDFIGSYDPMWWAGVCLMTAGTALALLTPAPKKA